MYATPDQAKNLLEKYGIEPATSEFFMDSSTKQTLNDGQTRISDVDFFRLLGADDVKALDVSDYEGAEIVHSLNEPIPDELEGACDFLLDGSTLDNIFNPPAALHNIARLLKPGGRCILDNRGNAADPGIAYMMFSAPWFFDFFVANNFRYCQVWSLVHLPDGRSLVYMMSPEAAMREWGSGRIHSLLTNHCVNVIVFAEKGSESTWDRAPTQQSYRGEAEWQAFSEQVARYLEMDRPPMARGDDGPDLDSESIKYGWLRILPDGTMVRPASGRKWLPDGTMVPPVNQPA